MLNQAQIQFKGLNSLRFLAALAVMLSHSTQDFKVNLPWFLQNFSQNLQLGVDLFFIISGFLITYLLLIEKEELGSISLSKFYIRRILRIFPLYYLIVAIVFFKYHSAHPEIEFSYFLTFLGNFWFIIKTEWTVGMLCPLWSICIEEHFYLVIPILVGIIASRNLHFLFGGIILLSIAYRCYVFKTVEYNWMSLYCHTLSRCDLLAMGGLLALYRFRKKENFTISGIYLVGTIVFLVFTLFSLNSIEYVDFLGAVFKKYIFAIPLLILFVGIILNTTTFVWMETIKQNRLTNYLGKISFGLYLFHAPICDLMVKFPTINNSIFLKPLIVILLTSIVATLSYEFFEKPILRFKAKYERIKTINS